MSYNLLPCDRVQSYLMPPSLQEWLAEGDLAWFILDAVDQMDLDEFYAAYRSDGWGTAAYNPAMMVEVLLYAYCQGIRSSRKIARALERDVGFRVVAANQQPDFRTICRFRSEHEKALERLFVQVLRMCREAGLVKLGVVALDGSKVAANAALDNNRSYEVIEAEVRQMLANSTDPDSRVMKTRQGYVQGYNVQAVVSQDQIIVVTTKDWKQRQSLQEKGCPRGRIPKRLSPRKRMERKLLTQRGRALYKLRSIVAEPVLCQVKEEQGFRRFMRRGICATSNEWSLMGTTHNLLKLWRSGQAPWIGANARWN